MSAEGSETAQTDINIVNTALGRLNQNPIQEFGQNPGTGLILQQSYNMSRDGLLRKQPWTFARCQIALAQLNKVPVNLDIIPPATGVGTVTFSSAFELPNNPYCLRVFRFSPRYFHWRIIGRTILTDVVPRGGNTVLLGAATPNNNGADNQPGGGYAEVPFSVFQPFGVPNSPPPTPPPLNPQPAPVVATGIPVSIGIEFIRRATNPEEWDSSFTECFIWKLTMELSFGLTGLAQAYTMAKEQYEMALADAAVVNGIENWPDPFWNDDLVDVRFGYAGGFEGYQ